MMAKCLETQGVKRVFGYPGAAICPFYDALTDTDITQVLVRQEQNSAHMASGYARSCGEVGVCIATSGPGATNLITGIATAYMDSIPMVAITGQVCMDQLGRDSFQETDITGACESVTKHSYLVKEVADIPRIMREAFSIAATGRPGPVLIDIPEDVQMQTVADEVYENAMSQELDITGYKPKLDGHPMQVKRAMAAIKNAKRPVICCGGGVVLAGAREEMIEFAQKSGIPVLSTMMGIGVMPMDSPLYLGMIGRFGRSYANRTIRQADLIILCGARVGDRAIAIPGQIAETAHVIHIDADPAEIGKNMQVDIPIVGDVKKVLEMMAQQAESIDCPKWIQEVTEYKNSYKPHGESREDYVEPRSFIRNLSEKMDGKAILVADVGQSQIWAARNFSQKEGRFLTSGGLGTMGYSLPAAIGAKLAKPERQVLAVTGDGAFQMSFCELATAVENDVQLKLIVMDNSRLGMVREMQKNRYKGHYNSTTFSGNPDFVKLCTAYGIKAKLAQSNAQADEYAAEMLESRESYVLICKVDPETPTV